MMNDPNLLLAPGLASPEKMKKYQTLIDKRNTADYKCYMILRRLVQEIGVGNLTKIWADATGFSVENVQTRINDVQEAIRHREDINDQALSVLAGRG
jgi:hypothetical protein